ncbi:MAG TPA: hypothetical protein VFX39_00045 [Gemmatimonadaceae bacterium]|nr:hypothetical protein [Gemmatimonadaceae bacterium]
MTVALAYQAARAQALLDRIADVSDVPLGQMDDPATIDQLLAALDAREALLSDLQPVVAELSMVRGQIASQESAAAEARAFDLAIAPVEVAARRALSFHEQLLEKMKAMRDEMLWELDRVEQLDAVAEGYLSATVPAGTRLDVRR